MSFCITLPYKKNNDFSKSTTLLVKVILVYSLAQFIRSVLYIDEIKTEGNNWLTLFANDSIAQSLLPIAFIYFSKNEAILKNSRIALFVLLYFTLVVSVPQTDFLPYTLAFVLPFFYYPFNQLQLSMRKLHLINFILFCMNK